MKKVKFLTLGLVASGLMFFTSCSSDDSRNPEHIEDHDQIESVVLSVTPTSGEDTKTVTYTYKPGEEYGQTITLKKGVPYQFEVTQMNAADNENQVSEVLNEKEMHFFVYQTTLEDYTFKRADIAASTRKDGTKIGLKVDFTVNKVQSDKTLNITLMHQPSTVDPNANGGLGATTGGATDLSVKYKVNVVE